MKIYTGYYGNLRAYKDLTKVAISLGMPKWVDASSMPNMRMLNPKGWMLKLPEGEYTRHYMAMLGKLDYGEIVNLLESLSLGRDVVLLCYEVPGVFCHRHLVADWISQHGEYRVGEYYGEAKEKKQGKPEEPNQPMLFDLPAQQGRFW